MKAFKITFIIGLYFILSCNPPHFKDCPEVGIYSEECPCASNMYRWNSYCHFKNDGDLLFRGKSAEQSCLGEFQLIFSKVNPMDGFIFMKMDGFITLVNIVLTDDIGIYSESLSAVCKEINYPIFQLRLLTKDISEKTETIKGYLYWWNHENQSYHDTEEKIELKRFRY